MSRTCKGCGIEKQITTEFYIYNKKDLANKKYFYSCKECMRKKSSDRYIKIGRGSTFLELKDETRNNIIADMMAGVKLNAIAIKYDLCYANLCYWNRKNLFNLEKTIKQINK